MKVFGFHFDTSYTTLPEAFFSQGQPAPCASPEIVIVNHDLAHTMGLDIAHLERQQQAALFSGNSLPEGAQPFAQAYAGHQFGHFTMLGDGRALVLGEHLTPSQERLDIQFKGSGTTPYSRGGDGKAALGPMLREYLIAEAMHALGVPTTRSLAVVTTGETVIRDTALPGAILTRVASSHIRVGTFQFAAYRGEPHLLKELLDYTINRHFPELNHSDNKACDLIHAAMEKQIDLIVHWMRVGFIHGVMNTDNTTLSGETIDYGPCAFMDAYNPATVFSSIDHGGRYAFGNQGKIAQWNLARLAETLLPLIDRDMDKAIETAEKMIGSFQGRYQQKWLAMMAAKLGLFSLETGDSELITELLQWMQDNHADYTNTFRDLSNGDKPEGQIYQQPVFGQWYVRWQQRLQQNSRPLAEAFELMQGHNPAITPRNHKVEEALAAAHQGDLQPFHAAVNAFKTPYKEHRSLIDYQKPPEPSERVYQTFCGT